MQARDVTQAHISLPIPDKLPSSLHPEAECDTGSLHSFNFAITFQSSLHPEAECDGRT